MTSRRALLGHAPFRDDCTDIDIESQDLSQNGYGFSDVHLALYFGVGFTILVQLWYNCRTESYSNGTIMVSYWPENDRVIASVCVVMFSLF